MGSGMSLVVHAFVSGGNWAASAGSAGLIGVSWLPIALAVLINYADRLEAGPLKIVLRTRRADASNVQRDEG